MHLSIFCSWPKHFSPERRHLVRLTLNWARQTRAPKLAERAASGRAVRLRSLSQGTHVVRPAQDPTSERISGVGVSF